MTGHFAAFLTARLKGWLTAKGLTPTSETCNGDVPAADGESSGPVRSSLGGEMTPRARILLHVGCGHARKEDTGPGFQSNDWKEIRLDIDPDVQPDIVGTMLDMSAVASESIDAVFSSHNIEHLYPHEVPIALKEFHRVLKPRGFLVLTCPDLQSVCQMIAEGKLIEPAYVAPAGPIAPIDILYGHRPQLAVGNFYMAHHSGFTLTTLMGTLKETGYGAVAGKRREAAFDLWVLATSAPLPDEELRTLAALHFPN